MRILISGAGITGHTVAYWLRSYGFTPTVVKRAPSYQAAFARYESETRPFVMLNQPLRYQIRQLDEVQGEEECICVAARTDDADRAWPHGGVFYQSLHQAHTPRCQRDYPQGLSRLISRAAVRFYLFSHRGDYEASGSWKPPALAARPSGRYTLQAKLK